MPTKSKMMVKLYGSKVSDRVYEQLQELYPILNEEIQKIAYDHYWKLPGLSMRDKSLVTLVSLIVLHKEEQTRIHINGFINSGGTKEDIFNMLTYLAESNNIQSSEKGFEALIDVLIERDEPKEILKEFQKKFVNNTKNINTNKKDVILNERDRYIIDVASCVALGQQEKTKTSIKIFLNESPCSKEDLKNIFIHQIVYCGFPSAMNGFSALKSVLDENDEDQGHPNSSLYSKL